MAEPSLTVTSQPTTPQLDSQLEGLDAAFDALETSTDAALSAMTDTITSLSNDLGEFEDRVQAAEDAIDVVEEDVAEIKDVVGYELTTNSLIETALAAGSPVLPTRIAYQGSDVDDLITLTGAVILKFVECSNVAFSFRWTDNAVTPPKLIFQDCTLNSSKADFLALLDIENATEEIHIECLNCYDSNNVALSDFSYRIIGGLS